jgi:2-dehydro-3-deoxygluconokinase
VISIDDRAPVLLAAGETMAMVAPVAAEPLADAVAFHVDAGGAESNVAAHVAAAGLTARWFGRLGDDPLGRRIVRQLADRGVDVSSAVFDAGHPTGVYFKDPGSGVRYYRSGSAGSRLSGADAEALDLDGVAILHVSGITAALSEDAAEFLDRAIDLAHEHGAIVSFDVNHRPALWDEATSAAVLSAFAVRADVVFVGRDEAETLWQTPRAEDVRARFPEVTELVVKDGAVGATAFTPDGSVFEPAPEVEVVEAVGAGDAFAGGYLAALLEGLPIADRLRAGHGRAARTLQTTADSVEDHA